LGLPWLIQENLNINYRTGQLQWRPTPLSIVENNNDKEGGDSLKPPYLFLNSMAYDDSFPLSLAETFEEPDITLDISCLDILQIKLSDHFNQLYRSKDKDTNYKGLVPKFYHEYLQLFSKKASE
jgi:hypothetical protein